MSDSMSFMSYIPSVLYILAEIILLIASFLLVSRHKSGATMLMLVACIASVVFSVIGFFAFSLSSIVDFNTSYTFSIGVSILGAISNILFAIGLGMFALNSLSKSS